MKRILCLILALLMLFFVVGCGNNVDNTPNDSSNDSVEEPSDSNSSSDIDASTPTVPADKTDAPKYDGVFKTGYARACITPSLPIDVYTEINDDLYATCFAVNDGEKTVLFISIDIQAMMEDTCDGIRNKVKSVTKIPTDNIFITATHCHSAVHFGTDTKWTVTSYTKIANAAKEAIEDLSDTEIFVGTGKTTGMAWVRRYVNRDGSMSTVTPAANSVRSVSDADDVLQVVRFVRKDKKDIVATNWQAHLAHAINENPNAISADIAHHMRQDVEAGDNDALLIYFAGASGNINLTAPNKTLQKYKGYVAVAKALAKETLNVLKPENLTKIEAGKINIKKETYNAENAQDSAEEIAAAQDRLNRGVGGVLEQAGDKYLVARNKSKTSKLRIAAVSIGDLGLITVPYEMFDNNGVQIKEGSPFKMTLILTNSDGAWAYMPSYEACTEYGGYETEATYFATGVAEKLVAEYLRMLNELKAED